MSRELTLRRRIKILTWLFIVGLVLGGVTAIPLDSEVAWLVDVTGADSATFPPGTPKPAWALWLARINSALQETAARRSFLFYGTDWLAFGHFAIAVAFFGAVRDPLRNRWLFDFGLIACALVVPYALIFGAIRGIPLWWRLIDCSFGVVGFVPLWFCRAWSQELEPSASIRQRT
ncbi:MAG: hypothetical protein ABSA69_07050 [Verrucomicrobiota bacterium]|jgi:hypothetical protein